MENFIIDKGISLILNNPLLSIVHYKFSIQEEYS